jgi:translation initiation factor IF-2
MQQQMSGGSMSGKVRVYEVAKQLNLDPKQVVGLFQAIGVVDVRNHMSSVDSEAVERVKRHLEKQRTHDVVEERIRPDGRVVKRRAIAKAGSAATLPDTPSNTALPSAPVSARPARQKQERIQDDVIAPAHHENGHAIAEPAESDRLPVPEDRPSVHALEPVSELPPVEPIPEAIEPAPPSERPERVTDDTVAAASPAVEVIEEPPQVAIVTPEPVPVPLPPPVVVAAPPPPVAAPSPRAPAPTPAPEARPSAEARAAAAAARGLTPKTGVEYWTGRPGVPMPAQSATRAAASSSSTQPNMPRRVQYDPRAGTMGGPSARRDVRAPGQQPGRPMMGRGTGGAGRRPMGPIGPRKPSMVSTQEMSAHKKVIRIESDVTLQTMAQRMSLKATELLMKLLSMGMSNIHINTTLDADTAKILAGEFGWEVEDVSKSEEQSIAEARGEEEAPTDTEISNLRPPVVTVMGHVDHGKTSLLDKIRKADVAGGEAGGITQHIGAYRAETKHGTVVFLDTPGHEAFTQMRARGASVTDIIVLVVAADDGVMPQTKEAVAHAKAAKVPIIVAINKIDKPAADPERVKRELGEVGLVPEEWGGETIFVNVSATTGEGIEKLIESIQLQSELLELRANAARSASGTVLEALLDRGRGPVARVLVQDGTLRVGDFVLAGAGFGKVRAMTNEHGKQLQEAGPATPVEILGLNEVPNAGDRMDVVKDPKKAQEVAESRKGKMAKSLIPATAKVSLEELSKRIAESGQQELRVIIKGDVQGSVEALAEVMTKLSTDKVRLSVINAAVGAITEGDVNLAIASRAIIVGFNVRPAGKASTLAEENKIEIRLYSIIYNALEDLQGAMEGLLPPTLVEKRHGKAEVRQIFKVKGIAVAGCYVTEGKIVRSGKMRLLRDNNVVWDGKIESLKRFKDDAREVPEGFECGISLENFNDLKEKDILESYEVEEIKQKL